MTHKNPQRDACAAFLELDWQGEGEAASAPELVRSLLTETASLTARLRALCGDAFRVQVMAERHLQLDAAQADLLEAAPQSSGLIREVLLCCGQRPLIFACTLAPAAELAGRDRWLADLGSGAVGDHVFGSSDGGRDRLEIAKVPPDSALLRYAMLEHEAGTELWARRSRLHAGSLQFEVMEFFLPGVEACIHASLKR